MCALLKEPASLHPTPEHQDRLAGALLRGLRSVSKGAPPLSFSVLVILFCSFSCLPVRQSCFLYASLKLPVHTLCTFFFLLVFFFLMFESFKCSEHKFSLALKTYLVCGLLPFLNIIFLSFRRQLLSSWHVPGTREK